jgi:hypothetical protein
MSKDCAGSFPPGSSLWFHLVKSTLWVHIATNTVVPITSVCVAQQLIEQKQTFSMLARRIHSLIAIALRSRLSGTFVIRFPHHNTSLFPTKNPGKAQATRDSSTQISEKDLLMMSE